MAAKKRASKKAAASTKAKTPKPSRASKPKKAKDCGCSGQSSALAEPMVAIIAREAPSPVRRVRVECMKEDGPGFHVLGEADCSSAFETACGQGKACIPWLRVTRDPAKFNASFDSAKNRGRVETSDDVFKIFWPFMIKEDQEVFYALSVDTQMFPRAISEIVRGGRDRVSIPMPDVLRVPLVVGATGIFVAHNHPSGYPRPSEADKSLTKSIREACEKAGIEFRDHLVIGADSYYSFKGKDVRSMKPWIRQWMAEQKRKR